MRTKDSAWLLPLVSALGSGSAAAQDSRANVTEEVTEEVIVIGEQIVTDLDRSTLDSELVRDVYDTVRYIPGVSITDAGRFGSNGFNIRGLDSDRVAITVDGLAQGESLDPPSFTPYEFFRSTRNAVDVESVKSVRIVKGPSSVTAGNGALGGAVMYTTRDPADFLSAGDDTHFGIKTGYDGRSDETMLSASFANRSGQWESLLVYTGREGHERESYGDGPDIVGPGRGLADPFDYDKRNLLGKVIFRASDAHAFGAVFERYAFEGAIENLSRQDETYQRRWSDDRSERSRLGIFHDWTAGLPAFDTLSWSIDRQEIDSHGITLMQYCLACDGEPHLRAEDRRFDQEFVDVSVDFGKTVAAGATAHELVYGVGAEQRKGGTELHDRRYNGMTEDTGPRPGYHQTDPNFVPRTEVDHLSFYVRDDISLGERWSLSLGARHDRYDYSPSVDENFADDADVVGDVSFSGLTWHAGGGFELAPGHRLIATFGTGFKAPTLQQMYLDTSGNTADDWDTIPNPDLESEQADNFEVGYEWRSPRGLLRIAAFRSDYDNFIEYLTYTRTIETSGGLIVDDYTMPSNAGAIAIEGYEIEGRWNMSNRVDLRFAYSHNEGEYRNDTDAGNVFQNAGNHRRGDPLASISPDSAVVGLGYRGQDGKWGANANLVLTAEKKRSDAVYTDGNGVQQPASEFLSNSSAVLDVFAYYRFGSGWRVTGAVTNLTDDKYFDWHRIRSIGFEGSALRGSVTGDGINRYSEPGRSFALNVEYTF